MNEYEYGVRVGMVGECGRGGASLKSCLISIKRVTYNVVMSMFGASR